MRNSIVGHGWRSKQAHDVAHDRIRYRRGYCVFCGTVVSFLPAFSLPYTQYSLVARSEVLRRRWVEDCSWEDSAPTLKDPDRVPAPSTLRRWCRSLDSCSWPACSDLRRAVQTIAQWLDRGESPVFGSLRLCWPTIYPCLRIAWPWPLRC